MLTLTSAPTGFNCVHLPIVYEYSSDLFPTNTVDTPRAVTSFSDDNGYCRLTLAGDIKATGSANELEFVKVEVDGVEDVYQIYNYYSDTDITIDLGYDAGFVFGDAQYYYSNYHGRFKIYAGLRTGHTYNSSKPTRLITEIRAVPDSSGVIKININEILKSDINILGEGTDENDITQFTEFYVDFAESYDQSLDGYTLVSYVSSYTDDSANYAIATNSKLPFKNGNGGEMTLYSNSTRKFLNMSTELFIGNTFKVYFIGDDESLVLKQYPVTQTDTITFTQDEGIYQQDIESYILDTTTYCTVQVNNPAESEVLTININRECSNQSIYLRWRNYLGGMDHWLFTAEKEYTIEIENVEQTEDNIFINWPSSYNADKIKYDIKREARESILVRSQNLTLDQLNAIKYIKTSPYVVSDRVVLVDNQSFTVYTETDKLYSISFKITFTDLIPSQSL